MANEFILPDESEAEFQQHKEGWLAEYQPQTDAALHLVSELAVAHWYLLRARKWYNQILQQHPHPLQWTEDDRKQIDRFTRDRIAAERSFQRAFRNLEQFRKTRTNGTPTARERSSPSEPLTAKSPLFQGQNARKNQRKLTVLDQWVEVTIDEHGNTVTQVIPSNEELIKEGQAMDPPPDLVYRRFHFVHGVPSEYHWVTSSPERRQRGGFATQRMTVETWLETIAREQASGSPHLGPCGQNLPRPKARGECDCPICLQLSPDS